MTWFGRKDMWAADYAVQEQVKTEQEARRREEQRPRADNLSGDLEEERANHSIVQLLHRAWAVIRRT